MRQQVWEQTRGVDSVPAGPDLKRMGWVMGLCRMNSGQLAGPGFHNPQGCWVSWCWRQGWAAGERVQEDGTR